MATRRRVAILVLHWKAIESAGCFVSSPARAPLRRRASTTDVTLGRWPCLSRSQFDDMNASSKATEGFIVFKCNEGGWDMKALT